MSDRQHQQLTITLAENGFIVGSGSVLLGTMKTTHVAETAASLVEIVRTWAAALETSKPASVVLPASPAVRKVDGKPREAFTPVPWIGPGVYEEKDGIFTRFETAEEVGGAIFRRIVVPGAEWLPHNGKGFPGRRIAEVITRSVNHVAGDGIAVLDRDGAFLWNLNARSSGDIVAYRPA